MSQPYENIRKHGSWSSRFLDSVGDGSGNINANQTGLYDLKYTVPVGRTMLIDRLIIFIEDTGNFSAGGYGALGELTNGIQDGVTLETGEFVPSGDLLVTSIGDWASLSHDVNYQSFGSGPNFLTARYTFTNDGAPLAIAGGQAFTVRCNDDLSGLIHHRFRIGGVLCPS